MALKVKNNGFICKLPKKYQEPHLEVFWILFSTSKALLKSSGALLRMRCGRKWFPQTGVTFKDWIPWY